MKTQKSPDCQFSTHCQFIANNSAKVAWRKMPEKTQYICSILHDHAMAIRWKFTILHQNMRFLTSENMIYGTRWLCFKTDKKTLIRSTWCWKGRCHYWKSGKLPRRQLFFYMLTLKHSWWHRRTSVPSRIYYIKYVIYRFIYRISDSHLSSQLRQVKGTSFWENDQTLRRHSPNGFVSAWWISWCELGCVS